MPLPPPPRSDRRRTTDGRRGKVAPGAARRSTPVRRAVRRAGSARRVLRGLARLAPAFAALALVAACADEPVPVGRVAVEPEMLTLPYPGSTETEIAWQPIAPLGAVRGELRVFVHLLDAEGELVRTFDHLFPGDWEVGKPTAYPLELYQSTLGEPLPAGDYRLTLGLHDADRRWPLQTTGAEVDGREYQLATIRVPGPEPAGFPRLAFSETWLASERGADRQILGRRWLGPEGSIRVTGAGTAGRLSFVVVVPELSENMERTLEEGEIGPSLRVASTCDASETMVTGTGSHRVDLSVPADAECGILFDPNYRLTWPGSRGERSVLLENLYWRAAGVSAAAPAGAASPAAPG